MSEYEVGFGKPPHANQFKPGQSGNPKGRPRGHKNVATILERISNERVMITENGKSIKLTKKEIALRQLMNKAMKGDIRALEKFITEMAMIEAAASERQSRSALALSSEQAGALRARLLLQQATLAPENAAPHTEAPDA